MTAPALRTLKDSNPSRHLTLLTSPAGGEAVYLIPEVEHILIYEPRWLKATNPGASRSLDFEMISVLKERRFDACVIFTTFIQSPFPIAMLASLANIPLRLAYCRKNPSPLLTDWLVEPDVRNHPDIRHEVLRQLDLVAVIDREQVYVMPVF